MENYYTMNRKPISVCIATYNGQMYIEQQLRSILMQLDDDDEVIIVDDCSKDETVSTILKMHDKRIKILINDHNIGVLQNFEKAITLSKNEYIFLSDQDDIWVENKVEYIMNIFLNRDVDLINHDAVIIDINGHKIFDSMFVLCKSGSGIIKNFIRDTYMGSAMAFKKKVATDVFPMPKRIGPMHDAWIGICSEILGYKVLFDPSPLINYRRHENNVSKRRPFFTIVLNRILLSAELIAFYVKKSCFVK